MSNVPNISNSSWTDPKVIIAIYAAIMATISLLWNIISSVLTNKNKVKIDVNFSQAWAQDAYGEQTPVFPLFDIKITNQSNKTKIIKKPSMYTSRAIEFTGINKTNKFQVINRLKNDSYPKELKAGEIIEENIDVLTLIKTFEGKINNNDKIWFVINDTTDKYYKSKKYQFKKITDLLELSKKINAKNGNDNFRLS